MEVDSCDFFFVVVSVVVAVVSGAVSAVVVSVIVAATAASADPDVVAGECGFFFSLVTSVLPFCW